MSRYSSVIPASSPHWGGIMVSSFIRNCRANTGDAPPVEMAIVTGERSTTEGIMKLPTEASSTTFTGIFRASARLAMCALTLGLLVAAMTRNCPSMSPSTNGRAWCWTFCPLVIMPISVVMSGAINVTTAPALSRLSTLRSATLPPPTTRH